MRLIMERYVIWERNLTIFDVLTDMAIASPAITINRTYQNYCKKGQSFQSYLPSQIAKIFINRMNTAESTATVELACERNLMMRIGKIC